MERIIGPYTPIDGSFMQVLNVPVYQCWVGLDGLPSRLIAFQVYLVLLLGAPPPLTYPEYFGQEKQGI